VRIGDLIALRQRQRPILIFKLSMRTSSTTMTRMLRKKIMVARTLRTILHTLVILGIVLLLSYHLLLFTV